MTIKRKAYIAGAFEHPTRLAMDKSVAQLHAECAKGALEDAGLTKQDVDGYFCASDAPGHLGGINMVDYMGLTVRHLDSTNTGGSSYLYLVAHAAESIERLITTTQRFEDVGKQLSAKVRSHAETMAAGVRRIQKTADFNEMERQVVLLERMATAMSTLADLEQRGMLAKVSSAMR